MPCPLRRVASEGRGIPFGAGRSARGDYFFFDPVVLDPPFLRGTFAPAFRASESPIAMACFRLVTLFPERPDLNWPRFLSCIARSTFSLAFFPYFRFAAMGTS